MNNVYAAPGTNFSDAGVEATTCLFAFHGRIGRVRWIAYTTSLWMLASLALAVLVQLAGLVSQQLMRWTGLVLSYAIWIVPFLVARRRLQDLDLGAQYLLGLLIPFINLYVILMLFFKRGDDAGNTFGPAPAPNDRKAYVLACLIPVCATIGILVAIAIPAYQHYAAKARASAAAHPAQAHR